MLSPARLVARHLRRPTGLLGSLVALAMNRGNRRMNRSMVDWLGVEPGQAVLDIGFGGGTNLVNLLSRSDHGLVAGVDTAPDMVRRARRRFRRAIGEGRLVIEPGSAQELPFEDGRFERVVTVNTIYFWPDVPAGLGEILRVMAPGARLAVGIRSPAMMRSLAATRHGFTIRTAEEIEGLMRTAGFAAIEVRDHAAETLGGYIGIIGSKTGSDAL